MANELQELLAINRQLLEIAKELAANFPNRESTRLFTAGTETVPAGSKLTLTFSISNNWIVKITELYADARADCSYVWHMNNIPYDLNEVQFDYGKTVQFDTQIILEVSNTGASSQEFGYYLKGWGNQR